jgi:hypothetical protein
MALDEIEDFRRRVEQADWPELALQLLVFACSLYTQKQLHNSGCTRTPESFVRQAAVDVANGEYGFDLEGRSLFQFLCVAVAHLIEEEAASTSAPV